MNRSMTINTKSLKSVLIIDDSDLDIQLAEILFKRWTPIEKVIMAADGEEALAILQDKLDTGESIPDYIFIDLNMPGMDGFEFLDKICPMKISRKELQNMRVIIYTSSMSENDQAKVQSYFCVDEYLIKPLTREKLMDLMSRFP